MIGRRIVLCLAAAFLATTARADDEAKAEVDRLQGRWRVVALESDGRKATEAELEAMKDGSWHFKGTEVTFEDPRVPPVRSTFELDPGTRPAAIDLIGRGGPEEGKRMPGIYKFEDDRLTICLRDAASASKGRPRTFATEAESGLGMITLERRADP